MLASDPAAFPLETAGQSVIFGTACQDKKRDGRLMEGDGI